MTTPAWSFESPVEYYVAKNAAGYATFMREVPVGTSSTTQLPSSNGSSSSGADGGLQRQPTLGRSPRPTPKPSPITPTAPSFVSEKKKPSNSRITARQHVKCDPTPERKLSSRWLKGKVGLSLRGTGGKDGGELRIFNILPPPRLSDAPPRRKLIYSHPVTMEDSWSIPDIQHLHSSVTGRSYAIALKLREIVEQPVVRNTETPPPVPPLPSVVSPKPCTANPLVAEEDVFAIIAAGGKLPEGYTPSDEHLPAPCERSERTIRSVTEPGGGTLGVPSTSSIGKELLQSGKNFLRRRQASETGNKAWKAFGRVRAKTMSKMHSEAAAPAPAPLSFGDDDDEATLLQPFDGSERTHRSATAPHLSPLAPFAPGPSLGSELGLSGLGSPPKSPSRASLLSGISGSAANAPSFVNTIGGESSASESEQVSVIEVEVTIFLSFYSAQERDEWFTILRSLAQVESSVDGRVVRPHRRLKINVLDVTEIGAPPPSTQLDRRTPNGSGAEGDEKSSHLSVSGSDVMSNSGSPGRTLRGVAKDSNYDQSKKIKAGWSWNQVVRAELILDDRTLVARTAWTRAENPGAPAFWGESFSIAEMPNFNKCSLLIYRAKDKHKTPTLFGHVDLTLVPSFAKSEDERYPVRSLTGSLIGEIRLNVSYQEIDILPLAEYNELCEQWLHKDENLTSPQQIMHKIEGPKLLYVLGGRGLMEGTMEYLARIALVEKVLMPRVLDTCTLEARAAGSTLFRSTTPLSKTLEVLMRMMCGDFLHAALGPTIRRTIVERVEPKLFLNTGDPENPPLNYRILTEINLLLDLCWTNMYTNRGLFPNFIRHILGHLFATVREFHDDGDDLLRYKAVSSFVFLRLIGPALMTPHLFGLTQGFVPTAQQRTLTLIAKVLHTLAFFSDRDLARHPDLALFRGFIQRNNAAMLDFLTSIATPVGEIEDLFPQPTRLDDFLEERKTVLTEWEAEAMPHMTFAGCIDLGADWAVMLEIWMENLAKPGLKLHVVGCRVDDIQEMLDKYAGYVERIHALAFPEGRETRSACGGGRVSRASRIDSASSRSLRSLGSMSVKSDESLPMLPRKWLGFMPEEEKRTSHGLSITPPMSNSVSPSSSRPPSTHTRSISRSATPDLSVSRTPSPFPERPEEEEEERIKVTLRPASTIMERAPSPASESRVGVERSLEPPSNIVLTSPHETTILLSGSPTPPVPPKLFPPPVPNKAKPAPNDDSTDDGEPPSKPRSPTRPIPPLPMPDMLELFDPPESPGIPIPLPEDVAGPNVVSPTTPRGFVNNRNSQISQISRHTADSRDYDDESYDYHEARVYQQERGYDRYERRYDERRGFERERDRYDGRYDRFNDRYDGGYDDDQRGYDERRGYYEARPYYDEPDSPRTRSGVTSGGEGGLPSPVLSNHPLSPTMSPPSPHSPRSPTSRRPLSPMSPSSTHAPLSPHLPDTPHPGRRKRRPTLPSMPRGPYDEAPPLPPMPMLPGHPMQPVMGGPVPPRRR